MAMWRTKDTELFVRGVGRVIRRGGESIGRYALRGQLLVKYHDPVRYLWARGAN